MKKEFNLSDMVFGEEDWEGTPEGFLLSKDVKEFIKRLKEEIKLSLIETCEFNNIDVLWNTSIGTAFDDINNRIDKLIGDKLIGVQKNENR